jgi:hypothetical protein
MMTKIGAGLLALFLLAGGSHTSAAADDDTWYSATVGSDACVPLAAAQQRLKTMLGFMRGPLWQTPSDVVYFMGAGSHPVRPVLITPNVQTFATGEGGTMMFIRGYERCLTNARSHGWTR